MDKTITLENITISFEKNKPVVKNVSTTLKENNVTAIIGESGSGKSVLGMSLLNLLPHSAIVEGRALYGQDDLLKIDSKAHQKVGKEITWVPQNAKLALNPMLSIKTQLEEILKHHYPLLKKKERKKIIEEALLSVGFTDPDKLLKLRPTELSGGMAQRVVMLFGLLTEPTWIIADEPTKGLDAVLRKQVYQLLLKISKEVTTNMLIITHDLPLAYHLSDEIIVMYKGEILEQGTPNQIFFESTNSYTNTLIDSIPSRWR